MLKRLIFKQNKVKFKEMALLNCSSGVISFFYQKVKKWDRRGSSIPKYYKYLRLSISESVIASIVGNPVICEAVCVCVEGA